MGRKRRRRSDQRLAVRLRADKRRTPSSRRWLERQLTDPYVTAARRAGLRSRGAFKLIELDDKFGLFAPGRRVIDLGAAPGGWSQVAAERVRAGRPSGGPVVAVDITSMEPIPGVTVLAADARDPETAALARKALGGTADVVLSDMAAPATGHRATDHLRVVALCEAALALAEGTLAAGGTFVCKVLRGGGEADLVAAIKRTFATVRYVKPPASRDGSAEIYVVATGFRGRGEHHEPPSDRA